MTKGYFITGTDTNVGKTWATIALMAYCKHQGKSVVGMKPVASGCFIKEGQLKNADALLIQEHGSILVDYKDINPYAYQLPISPHLAGIENPVNLDRVITQFNALQAKADIVIVEGAGGWYSPLSEAYVNSDLAIALALPVIMVVAIRLGCINQARLSHQAIMQSGVKFAGWIAVCNDFDMLSKEETISTIKAAISAPLLGILPYLETADFDFFSGQLCVFETESD